MVTAPPPGFVLDEPETPAPPPGFVPDAAPPATGQTIMTPEGPRVVGERRESDVLPLVSTVLPSGEIDVDFDPNVGVLGAVMDAFRLPGDVYAGRVDPMSPAGIARATELGMTVLPAARMGARAARPAAPTAPVQTTDELAAAANAFYGQAREAGLQLSEAGYARLAEDVVNSVKGQAFSPRKHPNIQASLLEIRDRLGGQQTLDQVDVLRQIIRDLPNTATQQERRLARRMVDALDDRLANLPERDVVAGNADAAVSALTTGRQIAATRFKSEMIDEMVEKAGNSAGQFTGSGFENALRTQFRQLANNRSKMRRFSKAEQQAIKDVARKGRVARNIGRVAPTGGMSIMVNAVAAGMNPWFALLTAAGIGGRVAATRGTQRRIQRVREAIQRPEPEAASRRAINRAQRAYINATNKPIIPADSMESVQRSVNLQGPLGP